MYSDAVYKVIVGLRYSDEDDIQIGIHKELVLRPLLLIIVLQAITDEFKTGCPWELQYADNLALIAEPEAELEE